ncbi:altered inheritance of mitochondria [Fusarium longipes]|uniref:Altered inheritance of mitochondria protein 6 n=1 Tax=Fusarium longipes TaxID=694270 RepID=A0A395T1V9_9HYPO|nr:altered inheritance of mitochondria [Fusarium longipes]
MCHSHNDYWRRRPLFSALAVGCASVEADVWLSQDGRDILVGHDRRALSPDRTLQSLYIDPLVQILDAMNNPTLRYSSPQPRGVFAKDPNTTLILFIDIKDDPVRTWPMVLEQLGPLRDMGYLSRHDKTIDANQSFWPGPITVVGTGNIVRHRDVNIGPNLEEWQKKHDVFLDAPLHLLTETALIQGDVSYHTYELEHEFYTASAPFNKAIGSVLTGFSKHQMETLRNQIQIAKHLNVKSRLWGLPRWPISYRDYVWKVLVEEGIDLLNANNVASAATRHWESNYVGEFAWRCTIMSYMFLYTLGLIWYSRRLAFRRRLNQKLAS